MLCALAGCKAFCLRAASSSSLPRRAKGSRYSRQQIASCVFGVHAGTAFILCSAAGYAGPDNVVCAFASAYVYRCGGCGGRELRRMRLSLPGRPVTAPFLWRWLSSWTLSLCSFYLSLSLSHSLPFRITFFLRNKLWTPCDG